MGECGSGCQSRWATGERAGRSEPATHTPRSPDSAARLTWTTSCDLKMVCERGRGAGQSRLAGGREDERGESRSTASRLGGSPGEPVVRERVQEVDRQGQAYLVGEDEREAETGVVGRDLCEATAAEDARGREGGTAGEGEDHGRGGAGRRSSCAWSGSEEGEGRPPALGPARARDDDDDDDDEPLALAPTSSSRSAGTLLSPCPAHSTPCRMSNKQVVRLLSPFSPLLLLLPPPPSR